MSTLKRIKTYLRSTVTNQQFSNLAEVLIKKSLKSNVSNQTFLNQVIACFATKKNRKIDLIYHKAQLLNTHLIFYFPYIYPSLSSFNTL